MKQTSKSTQVTGLNTPVDVLLGRAAMLGFMLAFAAYLTADVVTPGLVQDALNLFFFIPSKTPFKYIMNSNAELQNGRLAMIGIFAALGTYALTGQIIPGIFQTMELNPFKPFSQISQMIYRRSSIHVFWPF